jgi:Replication-relaxation
MTAQSRAGLPMEAIEILASLAQHRVLSTPQVRAINLPSHGLRWTQRVLARLRQAGLLTYVHSAGTAGAPRRLWYVTERGAEAAQNAGALEGKPRLLEAENVSGPLQAHTLAVNDAAICFLATARERGDEFGPLSWRHEVFHRLGRGRGQTLFADAVLTYLRLTEEEVVVEQRFLELDRATLSVDRLAAELARYAQLYRAQDERGEPLWRSHYPSFPPILCVLAGAGRIVLERRRDTAIALLRNDPGLSRAPDLSIRIGLAEDLAREGPFAPIFCELRNPEQPVDWLGEPA